MVTVIFCTYHKVKGFDTILRLYDRPRSDGTLIIDMLCTDGWWRCEPTTIEQFKAATEPLLNFQDTYPQAFLGRDK